MHELVGPDDGVDGTGLDAQRTADTVLLFDARQPQWRFTAVRRIQLAYGPARELRQLGDACGAPRWALIDCTAIVGNSLRVRQASFEAALRALRLGERCVDALDEA